MARTNSNAILKAVKGKIGNSIVVKQYGKKVVISSYPDMSKVKPSALQKQKRSVFKDAVAYAKHINNTMDLKAKYLKKIKKGETVYMYALKEYLKMHK